MRNKVQYQRPSGIRRSLLDVTHRASNVVPARLDNTGIAKQPLLQPSAQSSSLRSRACAPYDIASPRPVTSVFRAALEQKYRKPGRCPPFTKRLRYRNESRCRHADRTCDARSSIPVSLPRSISVETGSSKHSIFRRGVRCGKPGRSTVHALPQRSNFHQLH